MEQTDFYLKMMQLHPQIFSNANVLEFMNPLSGENSYNLFVPEPKYHIPINGSIVNIFQIVGEINAAKYIATLDEQFNVHPFDVVLSTNVLQHDMAWEKSLKAMYDEVRINGILLIIAAGINKPRKTLREFTILHKVKSFCQSALFVRGRKKKEEYYIPITKDMMLSVFRPEMFSRWAIRENSKTNNLEFYGIKK